MEMPESTWTLRPLPGRSALCVSSSWLSICILWPLIKPAEVTGALLCSGGPVFIRSLGLALAAGAGPALRLWFLCGGSARSAVGHTSLVAQGRQKPPGPGSEPVSPALALNHQKSPSLEPLSFSPLVRADVVV